jgi:hypothetical protein
VAQPFGELDLREAGMSPSLAQQAQTQTSPTEETFPIVRSD